MDKVSAWTGNADGCKNILIADAAFMQKDIYWKPVTRRHGRSGGGKFMTRRRDRKQYAVCACAFFLFFATRILYSSLFSVFLLDQGYSASQASGVSAAALLASFFLVPVFGRYGDQHGADRMTAVLLCAAASAGAVFCLSRTLWLTGLLYTVMTVSINTLHPVIERRATRTEFSYASVRIWGTVGNAAGTQAGGILYQYLSPASVYLAFSVLSVITLLFLLKRKDDDVPSGHSAPSEGGQKWKYPGVFILYLMVTFCFYAAMDTRTLYLTAYLKATGFSVSGASTVLFAASLAEIPVVLTGGRLVDRLACRTQLFAVIALLGIQLTVYTLWSNHAILIAVTLFTNSVVSMFFIMINLKVVAAIADAGHQIAALTAAAGIRSLAAVSGQLLGGLILDRYSYFTLFFVLTMFLILALILTSTMKFPNRASAAQLYR